MNFLKQFYKSSKIYQIFVRILTATAILGIAAWIILAIFVGGRAQSAPLTYHEVQNGVNYKARIRFESLEFLLRSRTISRIDVVQIAWADGVNPAAISEIKTQNRYLAFVSTEPISANAENLGVLSYTISFTPLIKTICVYYFALMLGVFAFLCVWRYARTAFLTLCGFYIFAAIALAAFPVPFAFIGLGGFILCVLCALKTRNSRVKLALSYFSVLPLCLGVGEIWLVAKSGTKLEMTQPHEILGYANTPLFNETQELIVDDELIARYTYTHDEFGNRIVQNSNENSSKCLVLYGGSFAYGSAVDDSETLTNFLAKELPEFRVINLGIGGTGAHTALARLEFKLDSENLSTCEEITAIYEAIPHHIYRAYGVFLGPRYMQDGGKVRYWGTYKDGEYAHIRFLQTADEFLAQRQNLAKNLPKKVQNEGKFKKFEREFKDAFKFKNASQKSYIKRFAFAKKNSHKSKDMEKWWSVGFASNLNVYKMDENNVSLYFSIVSEINNQLKAQYNAPLNIVLWDYDMHAQFFDKYDAVMKREFKRLGVNFYALSEMIADYPQDLERVKKGDLEHFKYRVSRWDTHPNALANEKIAKFLAQKIKNGEIKAGKVR